MRYLTAFVMLVFLACAATGTAESWDFETGAQGWENTGTGGVASFRATAGMLQCDFVEAESFDPYIVRSGLSIDTATHEWFAIEAGVTADGDEPIMFQFFFDNGVGFAGGDPVREFAIPLSVTPNQGIVKIMVHVPTALGDNAADWSGTLANIRVDMSNNVSRLAGYSCMIDRIAVLTREEMAAENFAWDFETGLQGWNQTSSSAEAALENGALAITYLDPAEAAFDPVVQYALPMIIDADTQRWLRLDIALTHATEDPVQFEVFAFPKNGGYLRTTFNVTPNIGTGSYFVDMAALAPNDAGTDRWEGFDTISAIRFDPGVDFADPDHGASFASSETRIAYISLSDGSLDPDNDGLSDLTERALGTHAGNPDSDGDGLSDGLEYALGTDPLTPDAERVPVTGGAGLALTAALLALAGIISSRKRRKNTP
jgi:hypothetical protein